MEKLKLLLSYLKLIQNKELQTYIESILKELDIDSLSTDLWGGAGPDCITGRLEAAYI